jgi:hypothetical protein
MPASFSTPSTEPGTAGTAVWRPPPQTRRGVRLCQRKSSCILLDRHIRTRHWLQRDRDRQVGRRCKGGHLRPRSPDIYQRRLERGTRQARRRRARCQRPPSRSRAAAAVVDRRGYAMEEDDPRRTGNRPRCRRRREQGSATTTHSGVTVRSVRGAGVDRRVGPVLRPPRQSRCRPLPISDACGTGLVPHRHARHRTTPRPATPALLPRRPMASSRSGLAGAKPKPR